MGQAVSGALRMRALIDDLLTYSRLTAASHEPPPVVESREALKTALQNLQTSLEETGARVEAGDLPCVAACSQQLARSFKT